MKFNIKGAVIASAVLSSPLLFAACGYLMFKPAPAKAEQPLTAFEVLGGALTIATCSVSEGYMDNDQAHRFVKLLMKRYGVSWTRAKKIWDNNEEELSDQIWSAMNDLGRCRAITDYIYKGAPRPKNLPGIGSEV
jgi:hypothetical protein